MDNKSIYINMHYYLFVTGSDRRGRLIKLTNHFHEFGSSGGVAICPRMGLLLCAGYDLDTGHSMINGNHGYRDIHVYVSMVTHIYSQLLFFEYLT